MSQKRKRLTLRDKIEIIKSCENEKLSVREAASKFNIGKTQVGNILKNKNDLIESFMTNGNESSKRAFPKVEQAVIDSAVYEWISQVRSKNIPISGPLIQEKALEVAEKLKLQNFTASNGWLEKFRRRHQISFKTVCGESASVDKTVVKNWFDKVKEFCNGYDESNIFNCDETGLFFRALPDKTMCLKGEKCNGGKMSKERLTIMLCVNMIGEFEDPLIIGKAQRPRCFRKIDLSLLNIDWRHNTRAWMTGEIMASWLSNLNNKMKRLKRKILLFLDNAACHPKIELSNIKLMFLPPNTTSACQPLDQGIIQNFKVHYRKKVLTFLITKYESVDSATEVSKSINVLDAILWIKSAISNIKSETVYNCFRKAGFRKNGCEDEAISDTDYNAHLEELLLPFGTPADCYVSIDNDVITENTLLDISLNIYQQEESALEAEDFHEENDAQHTVLSGADALDCVGKLKQYFLNSNDAVGLSLISGVQMHIENDVARKPKTQTSILTFITRVKK